ncbi:MAG: PTS sugar transporter subunit IIA [Gammaproteobacteria bacterium]
MASVVEILPSAHIFVGADWRSKKRVFEQAGVAFENASGVPRDQFFSALMQRERLGSTCIGEDGAIPHGRLEGAGGPLCALALLKNPIQYGIGDGDGGAVRTLFFLIAPAGDETHLELLGMFAAMLSDAALIEGLHNCADGDSARALLARWEAARGRENAADG